MIRFLGYLFLLLIVAAAVLFGTRYYLDRQASTYVAQAVPPIYSSWNFDALKGRVVQKLIQDPAFEHDTREMLRVLGGALGPLQSAATPAGEPKFGWKSDAEIRGVYAEYSVQAKFERGEAQLQFVVAKEGGVWRIAGFSIHSPAALDSVGKAIGRDGSQPAFAPGDPEATAIVKARALETLACVDSDTGGRCWDSGSANFKNVVSKQKYAARVGTARAEWGLLQDRKFRTVEFALDLPGAPPGEYARAEFEATFSRKTVDERVLFYKQDGEWVFSGYRWNERR